MKVHIEIDCTPEEARSFMGLPDVGKANDVYVDMMSKAMKGVNNTEQLQELQLVKRRGYPGDGVLLSRKWQVKKWWTAEKRDLISFGG